MGYFETFHAHNEAARAARRVAAQMEAAKSAGRMDLSDAIARAALPANMTDAEVAEMHGFGVTAPPIPAPPGFLDTAPVGSGKSRAYRQRIAATPPGTKVAIAVPDHRLAEEVADRLAQDAPGKTVMVWRGEAQVDPLNPGELMCRRHDEVAAVRRAGGKRDDLCGSVKRGFCPFHGVCGYRRQLASAGGADVVIFGGNAFLGDAVPSVLRRPPEGLDVLDPATGALVAQADVQHPHFDLLIVDEPVVGQLLHGLSLDEPERPFIAVRDLDSGSIFAPPYGAASQAESAALGAAEMAAGAFVKGLGATRGGRGQGRVTMGDVRGAFSGLQDGDIERRALEARRACLAAVVPLKDLRPDLVGSWGGYEAVFGSRIRTNVLMLALARLFGAVASAFAGPRRGLPDAAPTHNLTWASVPDGAGGREPGIKYLWMDPLHEHWSPVPTLILDATAPANPVALEKCWPGLVRATVPGPAFAPGAVHVRQVHDWSGSYTKLRAMVASGEVGRLARFLEVQNARVGGGKGSVVTALAVVPKFLEGELLAHWKGSPPRGLDLAHFGALRGQDKWRDVAYLAVVGRPLPPTTAVEDQAALITGIVPVEVRDYARADADYVMFNGEVRYRVEARPVHPDAAAESIRFSSCEAELVQAIGRARGIRRAEPGSLRIDVVTNVPVPGLVVDELVTLDEILAEADAGPVMLAAARGVMVEPGSRGFWALISSLTDEVSRDAARVAAARRSREHPLNKTIYKGGVRVSAHSPRSDESGAEAVPEGAPQKPSAQADPASTAQGTSPQTLPPNSPAVRDMLAAAWTPVILRPPRGRYAVRAYVRGRDEAEARDTLASASRLTGTIPPEILTLGYATPSRRRRKSAAPKDTPAARMPSPEPQDMPAQPPAVLVDAAPAPPSPSIPETPMPEPDLALAPPPLAAEEAEEKTITVTPDDLRDFGRALGLRPPTVRKTIEKFRVVARRDGPDEMARKAIAALISEAAQRRTCTPAEARAAVSGLTRAA